MRFWRWNENPAMAIVFVAPSFVLLRGDATFATVSRARILTASCLLQQVPETSRRLDCGLYSFLGCTSFTGAVSVTVFVVAVVVVRLVLVGTRLFLWI